MHRRVDTRMNRLAGLAMAVVILLPGCGRGTTHGSNKPVREAQSAPLPRPTTENQPRVERRCGQQVCIEGSTIGDLAEAWSISAHHVILANNLCSSLSMRCQSHPFANAETAQASYSGYAAYQRCLRAIVEDVCAHTNCQEEISQSNLEKCNRRLWGFDVSGAPGQLPGHRVVQRFAGTHVHEARA